MVKLRTKWNKDKGQRGWSDTASALCMSIWKIASESVLNLENEGFETTTSAQRFDILLEFSIFAIHLFDRLAHQYMEDDERLNFITAMVTHYASIVQDNRMDLEGAGHYRKQFIELFNERSTQYADYHCDQDNAEPGFSIRRVLGENVRAYMGDKHKQWVPDYVIDKEAPELYKSLYKAGKLIFTK